jgi:hypothetical protein
VDRGELENKVSQSFIKSHFLVVLLAVYVKCNSCLAPPEALLAHGISALVGLDSCC